MPSNIPSDRRKGSAKSKTAAKNAFKGYKPTKVAAKSNLGANGASVAAFTAQQELLCFFQRTFAELFSSPNLHQLLQGVKSHLYNRDYAAAFSTDENLRAYVVRWSPGRALCYRDVFLSSQIRDVWKDGDGGVVCIGGGAGAEIAAAAAAIRALRKEQIPATDKDIVTKEAEREESKADEEASASASSNGKAREQESPQSLLRMSVIDIADWAPTLSALNTSIQRSFLRSTEFLLASFHQADILGVPPSMLPSLIPRSTRLITMMFVTNELYTQSRGTTTKLLLSLAALVDPGCLLLILESAGSYSTVKIGDRTFPMGFLLDRTLLGEDNGEEMSGDWEKLRGEESCWFRLQEGLRYPLVVENMRYFVRVFRKRQGNAKRD